MINDIVHIVISFLHIKATKIESGEKYEKRFCFRGPLSQCHHVRIFQNYPVAGAIIGDGDRKSRDPRGTMIWDNFSSFRTNCAIQTSYIRSASRTCRGLSRVCCHSAWSKMVRVVRFLADFSQRWQGRRQGRRTRALLCTFMLWIDGQGEFFMVENFFNFAIWMNNICSHRLF